MKQVRLLPILVFAGLSLLAFKCIGLVTSGGYVLTGASPAIASGDTGGHDAPAPAQAAGGHDNVTAGEPTLTDTSPTLSDHAPTLGGDPSAGAHADPSHEPAAATADQGGHGDPHAEGEQSSHAETEEEPLDTDNEDVACAAPEEAESTAECDFVDAPAETSVLSPTERSLLQRLGERRTELDTREAELELRAALVEAAEKRMEERSAALAAIEARIKLLTEQKEAAEDAQIKSVAGMYESMRPNEAAQIFDELDADVLVRIARAMNARKLAPVLAKMSSERARELTARLALEDEATGSVPLDTTLAELPQILPEGSD